MVDFTVAAAARVTLPWLAMHGIHAVVGTTGFTDDDLATFRSEFSGSNCLIAANFAISAVLMMRFAELAAPFFDTAEIIELHHDAEDRRAVGHGGRHGASAWPRPRDQWAPDPTQHEVVPGRARRRRPGRHPPARACGCAAWWRTRRSSSARRARRSMIRQDSYDRVSFMPGVVLACKRIADHPGLTIGLDPLLGVYRERSSPGSAEAGDGGVVVGLLGDLGHELAVDDGAVLVEHDHRAGQQAGEPAVGQLDAVGVAEVAAERADAVTTFSRPSAPQKRFMRERQVGGHAEHDGVVEAGRDLVELAHAGGAGGRCRCWGRC